jgi:hypothetical protein
MSEPTAEQPAVSPSVSTDPARGRWHFSRIPSHLGRARTSTVVLAILFLAIGTLYLNIRPETPVTATTSDTGTVPEQPARATTSAPRATTTRPTTSASGTTTRAPATSTGATAETSGPVETTRPEVTTNGSRPASSSPPRPPTSPTVVSPPG